MMEMERFKAIVAAYGADAKRWPEGERAAAEAFAAAHVSSVTGLLAEERALDAAIEACETGVQAPSDLLMARILKQAPKPDVRLFSHGDRRALYALAACAVFGLVVGFAGSGAISPGATIEDASETIIAAAFQTDAPDVSWLGEEG